MLATLISVLLLQRHSPSVLMLQRLPQCRPCVTQRGGAGGRFHERQQGCGWDPTPRPMNESALPTGAFIPGVPVQPVVLRYPNKLVSEPPDKGENCMVPVPSAHCVLDHWQQRAAQPGTAGQSSAQTVTLASPPLGPVPMFWARCAWLTLVDNSECGRWCGGPS